MPVTKKITPVMAEPIAVYRIPPDIHYTFKKLLLNISDNIDKVDERLLWTASETPHRTLICNQKYQNIFTSFKNLSAIHTMINACIKDYISEIGYLCDETFISNAWLNCDQKGSVLSQHIHNNSFVSGTYYVNYSKKDHSQLKFLNSKNSSFLNAPSFRLPINQSKPTLYNCKQFDIEHEEGDIVLWMSHLIHGFNQPNPSNNRITLSFNGMPSECSDGNIYGFRSIPMITETKD